MCCTQSHEVQPEGNEKADEWVKLAAEEPDAHGVKWLGYSDRVEARAMPLPRSLAHLQREVSEKKWGGSTAMGGGPHLQEKV